MIKKILILIALNAIIPLGAMELQKGQDQMVGHQAPKKEGDNRETIPSGSESYKQVQISQLESKLMIMKSDVPEEKISKLVKLFSNYKQNEKWLNWKYEQIVVDHLCDAFVYLNKDFLCYQDGETIKKIETAREQIASITGLVHYGFMQNKILETIDLDGTYSKKLSIEEKKKEQLKLLESFIELCKANRYTGALEEIKIKYKSNPEALKKIERAIALITIQRAQDPSWTPKIGIDVLKRLKNEWADDPEIVEQCDKAIKAFEEAQNHHIPQKKSFFSSIKSWLWRHKCKIAVAVGTLSVVSLLSIFLIMKK